MSISDDPQVQRIECACYFESIDCFSFERNSFMSAFEKKMISLLCGWFCYLPIFLLETSRQCEYQTREFLSLSYLIAVFANINHSDENKYYKKHIPIELL